MAPPLISTFAAGTRGYGQGAGGSAFVLPTGIIIPYTGSTAPTDWTDFSSADDKSIVAAGSAYTAGDTGGSSSFSTAVAFSNSGAHNGNNANTSYGRVGNNFSISTTSHGGHAHNANASASGINPPYKKFKLIKATADVSAVPSGGIILGVNTLGGDVSIAESGIDRAMMGGVYGTTGGSNSPSMTVNTSSNAGAHQHRNSGLYDTAGGENIGNSIMYNNANTGGHAHNASGSIDLSQLKKIYCSAWSNASSDFEFEGAGIAMWESATPPDGWYICNGSNGTPDMRDHFVFIGGTDNHGNKSGNNALNWSASTDAFNTAHAHSKRNEPWEQVSATGQGRHDSYTWSHTHNASGSVSNLPPYYALYFIQKEAA